MSSEYEKEYEWVCGGSSEDQDFFLNVCQRQWEQKKKKRLRCDFGMRVREKPQLQNPVSS